MFAKKTEVIPFREFMSPPAHSQRKASTQSNIYTFFPPITFHSLFPVSDPAFGAFLIGGGIIVGAACLELVSASNGFSELARTVGSLFRFAIPVVCYGLIFWFLFSL